MAGQKETEHAQVGTASRSKPKTPWENFDPLGVYARAGFWLLAVPETLAWYTEKEYTGHSLVRKADGWLLIIRARNAGRPEVAFSKADSPLDAVRDMAYGIKNGTKRFRPDKYR